MSEIGKLDYSHFGKFLASLGILLFGIAIVLPWLFLQTSFNTLISASEIASLTPTAQQLIKNQQDTALWILQNIYIISGASVVLGLVLLCWGLYKWIRYQVPLDVLTQESEQLKNEALRRQFEPSSQTEVLAEKRQEASLDLGEERATEAGPDRTEDVVVELPAIENVANEYLRVEVAVLNRLSSCLPSKKVLTRYKVDRTSYDAIIRSDASKEPDVIIEIKALRSARHDTVRIREAMYNLEVRARIYKEALDTQVRSVLLFVYVTESTPDRVARDEQRAAELRATLNSDLQTRFLTLDEVSRLPCEEIYSLIY